MWPIAVIGFNRSRYLEQTLTSLVNQKRRIDGVTEALPLGRIALFQDGAVSQKSGERYAEDAEIAESIAVFRRLCPDGEVFESPVNLGIAVNIDRAERWMFDELKSDAGIFFEDDMVVSKYYLQSLSAMIDVALADKRIGYVACYGRPASPLHKQECNPAAYRTLIFNWAFAVPRRQYLLSKPYVDAYLDLVSERDYLRPDLLAIYKMLEKWGMGPLLPAQDVIRSAICCKTNSVRLNTNACLGKYIGADGTHHTPEIYASAGFDKTVLYPRPVTKFAPLDDELYQDFLDRHNRWLWNSLTPQARQWMVGIGLAERGWPDFSSMSGFTTESDWSAWIANMSNTDKKLRFSLDSQGRRRI